VRKKFPLEHAMNVQKGFFNLVARYRCVGNAMSRAALLARQRDPLHLVQEAGLAPGQVWTVAENLAPHRDSIP